MSGQPEDCPPGTRRLTIKYEEVEEMVGVYIGFKLDNEWMGEREASIADAIRFIFQRMTELEPKAVSLTGDGKQLRIWPEEGPGMVDHHHVDSACRDMVAHVSGDPDKVEAVFEALQQARSLKLTNQRCWGTKIYQFD